MSTPQYEEWAKYGAADVRVPLDLEEGGYYPDEYEWWLEDQQDQREEWNHRFEEERQAIAVLAAEEQRRFAERRAKEKRELPFLSALADEATAHLKGAVRRSARAEILDRNKDGLREEGTWCVWCRMRPPRGQTMLCQPCNVYRRKYGRCPPDHVLEARYRRHTDDG
jgi:hypothetical protein